MNEKKAEALKRYNEKRAAYMESPTKENWIAYCNAKRTCRLLGCII